MKKIDNFTNVYKVTKTLRFKLLPVGKTEENFNKANILQKDEEKTENYKKAKLIIDKFYNQFITESLDQVNSKLFVENVKKFEKLYNKKDKTNEEKVELNEKITKVLREEIVNAFKKDERFHNLFKGELIKNIIESNKFEKEEQEIMLSFDKFTTYFSNYFKNRENMFSSEAKVGSIAYRSIHENLPLFIYNVSCFKQIKDIFRNEINDLNNYIKGINYGCRIDDVFESDYFGLCLTGKDISIYNTIIGGISINDKKIQGLNEYINLYNQKNKDNKLKLFKPLYKQILQEGESFSFLVDEFSEDNEIYNAINKYIDNGEYKLNDVFVKLINVIKLLPNYDLKRIYINSKKITMLSNKIYEDWNIIPLSFERQYDGVNINKSKKKNFEEEKKKYFKNKKEYAIFDIVSNAHTYYPDIKNDFHNKLSEILDDLYGNYVKKYDAYKNISKEKMNIKGNSKNIEIIKDLLDAIKNLYDFIKIFEVNTIGVDMDDIFYSDLYDCKKLDGIVKLYNMVRNYVTKKPYSLDKIKLNFDNPTLLNGWDVNKEVDNSGVLLIKDNKYYLGIMSKKANKIFQKLPKAINKGNVYKKVNYKLLPGPNKMLPKVFLSTKGREIYEPSNELIKKYEIGTHKKGEDFNIFDMQKLIDYFKESICRHDDYSNFHFKFSDTKEYKDLSEFYKEVEYQGYKITYNNVPEEYIDEKVNNGELYLFQIYNKDFSEYSKGKKNLHTLYFEQVFDENNLKDVVYKLNGEAEVFYRKKSIDYKVTHKKNEEVINKNKLNKKRTSVFKYDLIKNKRFTNDQFEFHVPISINFKASDGLYNDSVNESVKNCKNNYIIGIDRGERNLIYIVVIDENGKIVEQHSLNEIVNNYNNQEYKTDYHKLLDAKEEEREKARKNWTTIENIKELKEGYVSQVVHKICELVVKYDAIIVMEDLNAGFKNTRVKVEKQVYQKFEKMLIDKLNLYVDKGKKPDEKGGLRKAYQLTRPYEGNLKMAFQNGFIYYVAPWNTSKIDPTTGFVNLFRFSNYTTIKERKKFFEKMKKIYFDKQNNYFVFSFDYDNYGTIDYKKNWDVCSYGKRIFRYRDSNKNNQWSVMDIDVTQEMKKLFVEYNIDINKDNIKEDIVEQSEKMFFDKLFYQFKLILQMRNSDEERDYLISPVKNKNGEFFDSQKADITLPQDADANGAYNIARKGLMIINRIKEDKSDKKLTVIKNSEWLEYVQKI